MANRSGEVSLRSRERHGKSVSIPFPFLIVSHSFLIVDVGGAIKFDCFLIDRPVINRNKFNLSPYERKLFFSEIPSSRSLLLKIDTRACQGTDTQVSYLEHVQAVVTLNATRRGDVELFLTSPMGTRSMILSRRAKDDDRRDGFTKWPFMTTHSWGEYPQGTWLLEVSRAFFRTNFRPFATIKILFLFR